MDLVLIAIGIVVLYFGGEMLVHGSVGLSLRHGLSPLIVGLTVMAFGTSAPELMVSVSSTLEGHGDIAFGNVIGSNIANILLILGIPALIAPIVTSQCDAKLSWFEMMFATLLFWGIALASKTFGFWQGIVLLAVFIAILTLQIRRARMGKIDGEVLPDELKDEIAQQKNWQIWGAVVMGLVLLPIGAKSLVAGAVGIAQHFQVPEAIIGLTVVAFGTSLPELAASISAAKRGETAIMIGNVVGSNLFNLLLILGATGIVSTSHIARPLLHFDMVVLFVISLLLGAFILRNATITRGAGFLMVMLYIAYIVFLLP